MDYDFIMDRGLSEWENSYDDDDTGYRCKRRSLVVNHNYYHTWVRFDEVSHETEKAFLVKKGNKTFWIPKKIIRDRDETRFFLHGRTFDMIYNKVIEEGK